ncbi:Homocysteine S-methyltransferase YbgG [Ceratocystis platani]|uniref:Homocysteine S-methyltransferase YbgG n=1 Tax=Ceratocystis fimbriata f. sp. platani TaxID=88771 RepID=A0A0F8BS50_CERFI|nr:Homocysteine S-methyltransferase YbgG [Ceratocystis platani]
MPCPIYILDGGLGTSLEDEYGVNFSSSATPLWSSHVILSDPAKLKQCQADFAACPVDILTTATYQLSVEGLSRTKTEEFPDGLPEDKIEQMVDTAVEVTLDAVRSRGHSRPALAATDEGQDQEGNSTVPFPVPAIALSFGPYGASMVPSTEYSGNYDADGLSTPLLAEWHSHRIELFLRSARARAVPRFWAFETIPRHEEVLALRRVLDHRMLEESKGEDGIGKTNGKEDSGVHPHTWISCIFPPTAASVDGTPCLPDGTSAFDAACYMLSRSHGATRPWGIGINCTKIMHVSALVRAYADAATHLVATGELDAWPALVLYPDGTNGEVYNTSTRAWEASKERDGEREHWEVQLANIVKMAVQEGQWEAVVVGGCCKASHRDIRRLAEVLKKD